MNFYFIKVGLDLVGMDATYCIEAENFEQAEESAREYAIDNAQSFGYEQDEEYFGDDDQVGRDFDEDTEEYEDSSTIEYYVELYDPELHDSQLYEGDRPSKRKDNEL